MLERIVLTLLKHIANQVMRANKIRLMEKMPTNSSAKSVAQRMEKEFELWRMDHENLLKDVFKLEEELESTEAPPGYQISRFRAGEEDQFKESPSARIEEPEKMEPQGALIGYSSNGLPIIIATENQAGTSLSFTCPKCGERRHQGIGSAEKDRAVDGLVSYGRRAQACSDCWGDGYYLMAKARY